MEPVSSEAALSDRARASALAAVLTALILLPAWGGFDLLLEPSQAKTFIVVRACCEVPIAAVFWLLLRRPIGRRRPELLTLLMLLVVQSEIAWMVVRASNARDLYLMGFALPLYGSACLMPGKPRWTGAVIVATYSTFGIALLTAPSPLSLRDLGAAAFYISTASVIGVVGHHQRHRLATRELAARQRLQVEQAHTSELLDQVSRLSQEDALTGLANRRQWDAAVEDEVGGVDGSGDAMAVLLIDLDHLKTINDSFGHATGDAALRAVAGVLTQHVKGRDLVARIGGDEFAVLLRGTDVAGASVVAHQIKDAAAASAVSGCGAISVSIGVAAGGPADVLSDVIDTADRHLYHAKKTRNSVAASRTPAEFGLATAG